MAGKMLEMKNLLFADFTADSCSLSAGDNDEDQSNESEILLTESMIKQEPEFIIENETKLCKQIEQNLYDTGSECDDLQWHNCIICDERFSDIEELSLHVQCHIKAEKTDDNYNTIQGEVDNESEKIKNPTKTGYTKEELFRDYIKIQVNLEGEPTYTCKICIDKDFNKLVDIREHMSIHEAPKNLLSKRTCNICKRSFQRYDTLLLHMRTHTPKRPYGCNVCGATFSQSNTLTSHKRIHLNKERFECDICHLKYRDLDKFNAHQKSHFESSQKCPHCDHYYTSSKNLRAHLSTHTGDRPYKCTYCEKTFRTSTALTLHIRVHTGEKPYKCLLCPYATKQSGCLKAHMRTHTGEKPYKCDVCGRAYSEKKRLVTHYRTHTGERPYKCPYCTSAFIRSDNLKSHVRTHTGERPYKCDTCGKAFAQKTTLRTHEKVHSGEKAYQCPFCQRRFRQNGTLTTHMRTHSGSTPYQCHICDRAFKQSGNLRRHIMVDHHENINENFIY